ncbi:MAG: DUF4040 domain-containing protein [Caldilineales bacterium]|nr:DUF4040 domain-containing protein [Caldilineales bacterium]
MINDTPLLIPLLLVLLAAGIAALTGIGFINRRLNITLASWALALLPLVAFVWLIPLTVTVDHGAALTWQIDWIPSLGLSFGFYFDSLSALFGLLVTGIGVLVIIYTGYYFKGDKSAWRFLAFMFLFMFAMLGLVMAGDVITLFIFWEATSIVSFLLVAYKYKDEAARKGGFKALFITGGGGIALLAGLIFMSSVAGSTELSQILHSGDLLRNSPFYLAILALIAFGAFTKSAQVPAHIWLPGAMTAPTPASAYLHSATMVKAGIYLMARLNPALGETDSWFWLLTLFGVATMLTGAYLGLKQNDMKALLAFSTISQLGVLMMLIGQDTSIAYKALVIGIVAHALYKSALFLVAGIVDHETGTRDMRRLGGLWRPMKATFVVASIAALSAAGLPPLFGFLAKETLLATATHPSVPEALNFILPAAAVVAGALLLAQMGMLIWETFLGKPKDPTIHAHEAPWGMIFAPAFPALFALFIGNAPEPQPAAELLASAASVAFGDAVKVSLELWSGINVPLVLSVIAISLGTGLFLERNRVRGLQNRIPARWSFDTVYRLTLTALDRLGAIATRLQKGQLRFYLAVILLFVGLAILVFSRPVIPDLVGALTFPTLDLEGQFITLQLFALAFAVGSALATVMLQRGFFAIMALSVSGLSVAILMVLEPAPDVALVQIVVDILAVVILVLALSRLPRSQRYRAWQQSLSGNRLILTRDILIALGGGIGVFIITLFALTSRPRQSLVTPFYEANAKKLTGATDIVGSIVVDFRLFDTLIEIAVFSMAGLGVYTLLRYAARSMGDQPIQSPRLITRLMRSYGIGGPGESQKPSAFVRSLTYLTLPLALVLAATHMMYGHDQPGDGFTAGVIVSLVVGLWYVVFGYRKTKARLRWLRPAPLIASGLLLAIGNGIMAGLMGVSMFGNIDYGELMHLPLPSGFHIASSFLMEVAIFLAVLGSSTYILDSLGHPGEIDDEQSQNRTASDIETGRQLQEPSI